jgi:hypothetical protein
MEPAFRDDAKFRSDPNPAITTYLRDRPKDILVAGGRKETDSIPIFSKRRVVASREFGLPFHLTYTASYGSGSMI